MMDRIGNVGAELISLSDPSPVSGSWAHGPHVTNSFSGATQRTEEPCPKTQEGARDDDGE